MQTMTSHAVKNIISYLPIVGLLCVVGCMPFYYGPLQRWSLYIALGLYIIDYIINKRWQNIGWNRQKWVYVAFIVFFVCFPIRQLFDPYYSDQFTSVLEHNLPFLVFGIIGLIGVTDKMRIEPFAWVMWAMSCVIALYLAVQTVSLHTENWEEWILAYNQQRIAFINTHMVVNMYWNLTVVLCVYTLMHRHYPLWVRICMGIGLLFIAAGLLISEGRTGLLTFLGVLSMFIIYYAICNKKWVLLPVFLIFALCSLIGLKQRDRFAKPEICENPRLYIWSVTLDMIGERPITGYGVCSARKEFVERGLNDTDFYEHYATGYILEEQGIGHSDPDLNRMHPHNAFLETWIQLGIVGVLVLVLCMLLPLTMHLDKRQLYIDLCLFVFFMQMLFENFGTQLNALYLCTMILVIHFHCDKSAAVPCNTDDTDANR